MPRQYEADGVSCNGQHICAISHSGAIFIYNEIPKEERRPNIVIKIRNVNRRHMILDEANGTFISHFKCI